jgi:hypothetical protein
MLLTKKAIELTGTVDEQSLLDDTEISEIDWLRLVSSNPVFDFLKDQEEDIYTLADVA